MGLVVCKPKVSMTSLRWTAALDCYTGQSKDRYCACVQSYSFLLVKTEQTHKMVKCCLLSENSFNF